MDKETSEAYFAYEKIFKDYPDVVDAKQMSKMLGVNTKVVYKLLQSGGIACIPMCTKYKVAKIRIIEYAIESFQNNKKTNY